MQRFIDLVPAELLNVSGAVFNSGKDAFRQPNSGLYLLGLNPGGHPEEHAEQTVDFHLHKVLNRPENWCEHRDEQWNDRPAGTSGMQPRVLHVLKQLGLDPGTVPSSNIIFERTHGQKDLRSRWRMLALRCWPVHAAVIKALKPRTIVCFGRLAGGFVRDQLAAHRPIGSFVETNRRGLATDAFEGVDGISVIVATHPSHHAWTSPDTDPSEFIRAVMVRQPGQQLNMPSSVTAILADKASGPQQETTVQSKPSRTEAAFVEGPSADERDQQLADLFVAAGLDKVFVRNPKPASDRSFSKLFVLKNEFRIRSIELYTNGARKLRIHHAPDAPYWLKEALRGLPEAKNPSSSGTDFGGDAFSAAKAIADVLVALRGPTSN